VGVQKLQDFYASLAGRGERSAGNDPFLSGLRATYVTGPWQFDTLKRYKQPDFEFTVWPFPAPPGLRSVACTLMATAGSSRRRQGARAAWDIISTMTGATGDRDVYTNLFMIWQCVNGPVSPGNGGLAEVQDRGHREVPRLSGDLPERSVQLRAVPVPAQDPDQFFSYASLFDAEWRRLASARRPQRKRWITSRSKRKKNSTPGWPSRASTVHSACLRRNLCCVMGALRDSQGPGGPPQVVPLGPAILRG